MQSANDQIGSFSGSRSKSTKLGDRAYIHNQAPSRPQASDKPYRLKANSIREVLGNLNQQQLSFGTKKPLAWDQFRQETTLVVPTFGNWKKENLPYAIDTELKPKRSFRIGDSHNSERAISKSKHPRFPRNSKLLSKFCSNELPVHPVNGAEQHVLPIISKTERLMPGEHLEPNFDTPILMHKNAALSTESTRNSREGQSQRELIAMVLPRLTQKREFARIYLLQKSRYEKILSDRGISCDVPQDEFNSFMNGLRIKRPES